jgi:hypothetical protein
VIVAGEHGRINHPAIFCLFVWVCSQQNELEQNRKGLALAPNTATVLLYLFNNRDWILLVTVQYLLLVLEELL